ncbi:MAG: Hsp70 family protein [Planctomycetota bacterium]
MENQGLGIVLERSGVRLVRRTAGRAERLLIPLASTALDSWGPSWHQAPGTPATKTVMNQEVNGIEAAACLLTLARKTLQAQGGLPSSPPILVCANFDSTARRRDLAQALQLSGWEGASIGESSWCASRLGTTRRILTLDLSWDSLDLHVHEPRSNGWSATEELSLAGGWGEWLRLLTLPKAPCAGLDETGVCARLKSLDPSDSLMFPHLQELRKALESWIHRSSMGRGEDVELMWLAPLGRPSEVTRILASLLPLAVWFEGEAPWTACEGAALASEQQQAPAPPPPEPARAPLGVKVSRRIGHRLHHGYFSPLIPEGAGPGATKRATFSTVAAGQKSITLDVLEGHSRLAIENNTLGRLCLEDIPPLEKPQDILVDFEVGPDGRLRVTAQLARNGQRVTARLEQGRPLADSKRIVDVITGSL